MQCAWHKELTLVRHIWWIWAALKIISPWLSGTGNWRYSYQFESHTSLYVVYLLPKQSEHPEALCQFPPADYQWVLFIGKRPLRWEIFHRGKLGTRGGSANVSTPFLSPTGAASCGQRAQHIHSTVIHLLQLCFLFMAHGPYIRSQPISTKGVHRVGANLPLITCLLHVSYSMHAHNLQQCLWLHRTLMNHWLHVARICQKLNIYSAGPFVIGLGGFCQWTLFPVVLMLCTPPSHPTLRRPLPLPADAFS